MAMYLIKLFTNNSLAIRLLLTSVTVVVVCSVFFVMDINYGLSRQQGPSDALLSAEASWISRGLRFDASGKPVALSLPHGSERILKAWNEDFKYRVVDKQGNVFLSSEQGGRALAPSGSSFDAARGRFEVFDANLVLQVLTTEVDAPHNMYVLQTASSQRLNALVQHTSLMNAKHATIRLFAVAVAIFGLVLLFTFWRMLKPVRRVSAEAAAINPHTLHARLSTVGIPGEVRPLVESFNLALGRLENGYRIQRDFLSSAAHELKTPLSLIRAQIELEENLSSKAMLLRDVDLMTRQVHQLLNLAELSEIKNYQFLPINPGSIAADVVSYLERLAASMDVLIDCRVLTQETVLADGGALFVLFKNLLENAIYHTPAEGVVSITVCRNEVVVHDEGIGIHSEYIPKLFTRFWRAPDSHYEGAGLGLSICYEIALAHGWQLNVRNANKGADFVLSMESI